MGRKDGGKKGRGMKEGGGWGREGGRVVATIFYGVHSTLNE